MISSLSFNHLFFTFNSFQEKLFFRHLLEPTNLRQRKKHYILTSCKLLYYKVNEIAR